MPTRPHAAKKSPTLLSMEPDWRRDLDARHVSPNTQRSYLSRFGGFCAWLSPDGEAAHCTATVADIDRPTMESFFAWLYARRSPNTVLNHHIALQQFFKLVIDYGDLPEGSNPLRWIKRPKPDIQPPAILSDEEMKALLATCSAGKDFKSRRDYAILRVFPETGLRLQELTGLECDDVHLKDGVIIVKHAKGGKQRTAAISVKTIRALGAYDHLRRQHNHADLPALWLSQRGAMSDKTIYGMIVSRARAAGLEHTHPHLLRHLFAHQYLVSGGQESSLLKLAGWSDSKMLRERYGASLATERAVVEHHKLKIGESW
jgi:site-specific recombinase XerD